MNKKINIVLISIISFCCLFLSTLPIVHGENRIDISVFPGFDGKAKQTDGYPVRMEVTNNGKDFSGDLVITIPRTYNSVGNKVIPINLASNTSKTIRFSVPGMEGMNVIRHGPNQNTQQQIYLYEGSWKDGKEVKIKKNLDLKPSFIQRNKMVLGVLTEQPDHLNYLKLVNFMVGNPEVIFLTKEDLPNTSLGLDTLDILVIHEYSINELSETRQKAIKNWILEGGSLVLGSSPGMEQKFGLLADLLPLQVKNDVTINNLERYNKFSEESFDISNFKIFTGDLHKNATTTYEEDGIPLMTEMIKGNGFITQFSYNIGNPSFSEWEGNDALWQSVPTMYEEDDFKRHFIDQLGSNSRIFKTLANYSLVTLSLLFVGYLLILVPVLYFILKKVDKREWAWIIIPAIAVISSVSLYGIGAKDRLGEIKTNAVSIISVDKDGQGSGKGSISFLSKSAGDYTISLNESYNSFPLETRRNNQSSVKDLPYIETTNKLINVHFKDVEFWSPRTVSIDVPYENYGQFTSLFTMQDGKFEGKVTNKFPFALEDVYLIGGRTYEKVGSLDPGESKVIQLNPQKDTLFQAPHESVSYQLFGHQPGPMRQDNDQEIKNRLLAQATRNKLFATQNSPMLVGFSRESLYSAKVNGKETTQENLHLISQPVKIELPKDESIAIGAAISSPNLSVIGGSIHHNGIKQGGNPIFDASPGSYLLTYQIPESFIERSFKTEELRFSVQERSNGIEYALYNVLNDEYEPIDSIFQSYEEKVQEAYIKDGVMLIKVTVSNSNRNGPIHVPRMNVEGVTNP